MITADVFATWIGIEDLTRREASELNLVLTIGAHLFITAAFFCATTLVYREDKDPHRQETRDFFVDLETPVVLDDEQDAYDRQQREKLGTMVIIMGAGMSLMTLIPNSGWGRLLFAACSLSILLIGVGLRRSARA